MAGLLVLGYTEDTTYRGNKRKFVRKEHNAAQFVGSRGSLRVGRTVSESYEVGNANKQTPSYKRTLDLGEVSLLQQGK